LQRTSNSLDHYSIGTRSPPSCPLEDRISAPTACKRTVSGTISLSGQEFFSPFPRGTGSLSVTSEYLALASGLAGFIRDSTCPALLGNSVEEDVLPFVYRAITCYGRPFQSLSTKQTLCNFPTHLQMDPTKPHYPDTTRPAGFNVAIGLGCSHFARHYSGNHGCFLFLKLLRCFSSLRCPHPAYLIQRVMIRHEPDRVAPFGYPRVKACLQLTVAFRSLPRPSSSTRAKASTIRP
jgi:hypothetical protein